MLNATLKSGCFFFVKSKFCLPTLFPLINNVFAIIADLKYLEAAESAKRYKCTPKQSLDCKKLSMQNLQATTGGAQNILLKPHI